MKKVWRWITSLFVAATAFVTRVVQPSVEVVENLKKLVDSPVADVLTAVIPGGVDDAVKAQLRKWLPLVMVKLRLAKECSRQATPNERLQCALRELALMAPDAQSVYWSGIATLLTKQLSDGTLSIGEINALVEYTYQANYKGNPR